MCWPTSGPGAATASCRASRCRKDLAVTGDLAEAAKADALLLVVPAQVLHAFADSPAAASARPAQPLVICAKGIEKGTGKLVTEVAAEALPGAALAILSGPSFARDVARGPAHRRHHRGERRSGGAAASRAGRSSFRPYASDDLTGVALGGAAKNVYAIACGVVEGMGLGENARAALLARSFAELARLGEALGAKRETLMGLSGLGDLVLTATSKSSRNFSFGAALGAGERRRAAAAGRRRGHRAGAGGAGQGGGCGNAHRRSHGRSAQRRAAPGRSHAAADEPAN